MKIHVCTLAVLMGAGLAAAQDTGAVVVPHLAAPPANVMYVQAGPAIAGDQVKFMAAEVSFDAKVVKGAPYSAESITETTQVLQDGNRIHRKNNATIYRDSEGRTRREQTLNAVGPWASGEPLQTIFINDPVANVHYVLDPNTKTARKMPAPQIPGGLGRGVGMMFHRAGPEAGVTAGPLGGGPVIVERRVMRHTAAAPATKTEQLGKRIIEGVEAEGTRTTLTIPAGEIGNERPIDIVSEQWYSAQLQTVVLSKRNDPMMGETVIQLTKINRGEPAPSLFQVPPDYTIKEGPGPATFNMRVRKPEQ